jgi:hypothetical protein
VSEPRILTSEVFAPPGMPVVPDLTDTLLAHVEEYLLRQGCTLLAQTSDVLDDGGIRIHFTWGRWPDETP